MAQDLVKQFSLDYLISGQAPQTGGAPLTPPLQADSVFELLSQPILRKLREAPNRTLRVFPLVDQLQEVYGEIRVEALAEVINRLEATGRIKVLQRHRYGDHELQLT